MQSSLSPGMHPAGRSHFVFEDTFEQNSIGGDWKAHIPEGSPLAEALRVTFPHVAHFPVTCVNHDSKAQFVCECGFDTGEHEVQTAVEGMRTHRTLVANEEALNFQCKRSEISVGGLR